MYAYQKQIFYSDIRPTFLFWARENAVALLRGANRPLLTKLIHQEVQIEMNLEPRLKSIDVDFGSDRVIQVQMYIMILFIQIIYFTI